MEVQQPVRKRQKKRFRQNTKTITKRLDFAANKFSKELVLKVFSYLSSKDLIQCAVVSLEWSRMANDEMLWKPLFFRRFCDPLLLEANKIQNSSKRRRASMTRYGGSWKTKYRIHHNWVLGNCYINDVVNTFNSRNSNPLYPHQLQFLHDYIFIVQHDSACIDIWKYVENGSEYSSKLHSSIVDDDDNNVHITYLKLFEEEEGDNSTNYLIAGYSNGGFTLWKLSNDQLETKEITNYMPTATACNDKVTSIGMEYPMILVCTESMKLSAFHVNPKAFSLDLVHCLQSPMEWAPVVIDIQKFHSNSSSGSKRKYKTTKDNLFKVVVCFGLTGGNFTTSIGIQELVLSTTSVLSSKHGFALNYEPIYPSSSLTSSAQHSPEQITSMVYSPPYLITAHPNNTMKQYTVTVSDHSLDIKFEQTLYGHTYQVDALAIDAPRQKLLSGDRSGIKIWDLTNGGECQVTLNIHKNQSHMVELPLCNIETLGSDEDKIVAVVNSVLEKKSFIRLWSFSSLLK